MKGTDLKYNNFYYNSVRMNVHVGTLKELKFKHFTDFQTNSCGKNFKVASKTVKGNVGCVAMCLRWLHFIYHIFIYFSLYAKLQKQKTKTTATTTTKRKNK